jgi:hypothetical protein
MHIAREPGRTQPRVTHLRRPATDTVGNTETNPATRSWTVDVVAPQIAGTTPTVGATDVSISTAVTVTFDEDMDPATIAAASFDLEITAGSVSVPATVARDAPSLTATLTPIAPLAIDTNYTAAGTTTATDEVGNPHAGSTWTFTTTAGPSTTLYLHNTPTPPTGDTTAQDNMAMDTVAPTGTILHRSVLRGTRTPDRQVQLSQCDRERGQVHGQLGQVASDLTLTTADLSIWVAMKDLKCDKTREITLFLRSKSTAGTTSGTITATATATSPSPGGGEPCDFRLLEITLTGSGTVTAGQWLELKIMVDESTGDSGLIAYDTDAYDSHLILE